MNFIVLGSGGCTATPRPFCTCPICEEAREEGIPYARTGTSLFLEDTNALFDTPEEVVQQLNRENISNVDYIFYTHWHPDHTMGMRVVEQLNMHFLALYVAGNPPSKKVAVCALPEVMSDLRDIKNKHGPYLDYYERTGLVSLVTLEKGTRFKIGDVTITPVPVENPGFVSTIFVIESGGKRVGYAPCDTKPLPVDALKELDVLIIGGILPEGELKDGYIIPEGNELRKELFTLGELVEIITELKVGKTICVHIEEEFGRSLDDYSKIEDEYKEYNIEFAFDSMRIEV